MEKQYKPYDLDINTLGFYVDRLLFAMIKRQNKNLEESNLDIQHSELIVMKVISALGGATQSQLAKVMGKERSGISRTLASLEEKGYIDRKPLNGKTNFVTLTKKGEEIIPAIKEMSNKLTERSFKGFSQKSRTAVLNYLERLYNNVLIKD